MGELLLSAVECILNDVRQTERHTVEPLIPELSSFEDEKLKRYEVPSIDQILAELIQAGGNTLYCEIY
jgi:hypothetical protein